MKNNRNLKLWYKNPAANWNEALPIGNGQIGGMIEGGNDIEKIWLNEESLWAGYVQDKNDEHAYQYLEQVRNLIFSGEYKKAQDIMEKSMLTPYNQPYQPLGALKLCMGQETGEDYRRSLDLESGIGTVTYKTGGKSYERNYFVSYPDNVLVIRITCSEKKSISLAVEVECPLRSDISAEGIDIRLSGRCPEKYSNYVVEENLAGEKPDYGIPGQERGMTFFGLVRVSAEGGEIFNNKNRLHVKDADSVTIYMTASTSYKEKNPAKKCEAVLEKTCSKEYLKILERHLLDYTKLFGRVELNLDNKKQYESIPTDERIKKFRSFPKDLGMISLLFQYGRYLMISSTRPGTLPSNLQGIWNADTQPPWWSNWTVNINLEMNYWPAEACGLPECQEPLYDFIESLIEPGKKTAQKMYGCRGFVSHHQIDIWKQTSPVGFEGKVYEGSACYAFWPMSSGWLCQHLWEHYLYSCDKEFLKTRAYPIMKEAALFYLDWLIEDQRGNLVTCPSTSPENVFYTEAKEIAAVSYGSTMDMQIIYDLFSNMINACEILNLDKELETELKEKRARLLSMKIGKHGQIQEYPQDFEEVEIGHRHMSHLFGLYPGKTISPEKTPQLAQAARDTLLRRLKHGGGHTGWSSAWIINLWARLYDGEMAEQYITKMIQESLYLNMLDSCPPFEIDGNFGFTAGVVEMLIQSHQNFIYLLPALPAAWKSGTLKGIRVRGGYIVDISWESGKLSYATLTSEHSGQCLVKNGRDICIKSEKSGEQVLMKAGKERFFKTEQGERFIINPV